jgi:hypothetical protein
MSEVIVYVVTPANIRSLMEKAEAGDSDAQFVIDATDDFRTSEETCIQCKAEFTVANEPIVYTVVHWPSAPDPDDDVRTAGLCSECVLNGDYLAIISHELRGLGVKCRREDLGNFNA